MQVAGSSCFRPLGLFLVCVIASIALHVFLLEVPANSSRAEKKDAIRVRINTRTQQPPRHAFTVAPTQELARSTSIDVIADTIDSATPARRDTKKALKSGVNETSSRLPRRSSDGKLFEEYIPRTHLTIAPIALTPVVLESPAGELADESHIGVLLLYIDETGKVHDVVAQEPLLPVAFEKAARAAFMTAIFSPGEFLGRPVKSSLRVEVVFSRAKQ